ncbi:hypothetical protein B0T26DRAFT_753814 [Lasiosphaeria miniovina]|uniref:Uncharacterized protein n=1 Tax=Lasiosphaeria miniovina TaxID=1954250 RepID=A0AA40AD85_9PEZI|nr:uncharacterized protein B0T26DRAFT_753814 [Lasiosphaeria miniovina]KAK0713726.1 hypothetical protein B0T26DRAFT_753814 [Lasiosphaeria miniovina]
MKLTALLLAAASARAHYTFPKSIVGAWTSAEWETNRMTENHFSHGPVTDRYAERGSLVSFPSAYVATDPGILFQLYWPTPTSYVNPGPAPVKC